MEFALCLLLAIFVANIAGYPSGAPVMVCESMTPGHMFEPQTSECPFVTHPEKVRLILFVTCINDETVFCFVVDDYRYQHQSEVDIAIS
jgi:hypothetical protein